MSETNLNNFIPRTTSIAFGFFLILSLIVNNHAPGWLGFKNMYAVLLVYSFGLSVSIILLLFSRQFFYFNTIDSVLFSFLFYVIIHSFFTTSSVILNQDTYLLLLVFLMYFVLKQGYPIFQNLFLCLAWISATLISLEMIFNHLFTINNYHFVYRYIFSNPSHPSWYLCAITPMIIGVYQKYHYKNKWIKLFFLTTCFLLLTAIILSSSRTSLIAFLASFAFFYKKNIVYFVKSYRVEKKISIIIILLITSIVFLVSLYDYKPDSALGRWYIWQVCFEIWKQDPLFGIGYGQLKIVFLDAQATFFKNNSGYTDFERLAGNTHFAFNEFLQILVELGAIGFILFSIFLFKLFKISPKNLSTFSCKNLTSAKTGIFTFILLSLFGYPLQLSPLLLLFLVYASEVSKYDSNQLLRISTPIYRFAIAPVIMILCSIIGITAFKKQKAIEKWKEIAEYTILEDPKEAFKNYTELYPVLKENGPFLYNYGSELSLNEAYWESIKILTQAKRFFNDHELYLHLGNSYKGVKNYEKAEEAYKKASYMIPHRYLPNYLLLQLYEETKDKERAVEIAKKIHRMPVKIPSKKIDQIKEEIASNYKNYLE